MTYPIPKDALDDRLAIVGTAGAGKTYLTMGAMEHLFARKSRVIAVDPLGVMWGLRLCNGGALPSEFQPVIFGGLHGDLPINEHAGALIGETVATMAESCIIDLSQLGTKAAERRFMLAFLTALYRHTNKEPVHVIVDEADMFAPQKLLDKDGDAAKLLGMMETVVRRGRVRGFIPWLITQRPAVLSKDVLSQADGLVALKLTASQDRAAIRAWVELTADQGQWKAIDTALPAFARGHGVVWIPARGILEQVEFPPKATYDSSRTPKRGEKKATAEVKPIDLGALKDRLAKVQDEAKANDPIALRAQVTKITAALEQMKREKAAPAVAPMNKADIDLVHAQGFREGWAVGHRSGWETGVSEANRSWDTKVATLTLSSLAYVPHAAPIPPASRATPATVTVHPQVPRKPETVKALSKAALAATNGPFKTSEADFKRLNSHIAYGDTVGEVSKPQMAILASLSWWDAMGHRNPTRAQVAVKAGMKVTGGHFRGRVSELKGMGMVEYDGPDHMSLTSVGGIVAPVPSVNDSIVETVRPLLSEPQRKIFEALLRGWSDRAEIAADAGMEAEGGHFRGRLSELKTFGIVTYPSKTTAALQDWVTA